LHYACCCPNPLGEHPRRHESGRNALAVFWRQYVLIFLWSYEFFIVGWDEIGWPYVLVIFGRNGNLVLRRSYVLRGDAVVIVRWDEIGRSHVILVIVGGLRRNAAAGVVRHAAVV
jgi:hypothetical protein